MFRIPSPREVGALFVAHRTVAGATKAITDTVGRLDDVVAHHSIQAQDKADTAFDLRVQASSLAGEAANHSAEAAKATAVSSKLTALLT